MNMHVYIPLCVCNFRGSSRHILYSTWFVW